MIAFCCIIGSRADSLIKKSHQGSLQNILFLIYSLNLFDGHFYNDFQFFEYPRSILDWKRVSIGFQIEIMKSFERK